MKTYFTMAVTILAVLLLSSGGLLVTHAATPYGGNSGGQNTPSSQSLSLSLAGGVASAGNQNYLIVQNGPAIAAVIDGSTLSNTHLTYTLNAQQQGLRTSGSANFVLTGQNGTGRSATTITVTGNLQIGSNVPAVCLPSGSITGACAKGDTSEVPSAFIGVGSVQTSTVQIGPSIGNGFGNGNGGYGNGNGYSYSGSNGNGPASTQETIAFESAYFNPFGDAITITSLDNTIVIVTNYTQATINWSNVVDAGELAGTLGSTAIAGNFTQVATEYENLVVGTAQDYGTIAFSNVVSLTAKGTAGSPVTYMDANGGYQGTSIIPHAGAFSCGTFGGIQVCTETGFQDQGTFQMSGGQGQNTATISGTYASQWSVPAFYFESIVNGHATQGNGFHSSFSGKIGL